MVEHRKIYFSMFNHEVMVDIKFITLYSAMTYVEHRQFYFYMFNHDLMVEHRQLNFYMFNHEVMADIEVIFLLCSTIPHG